jgi:hypothetical protein
VSTARARKDRRLRRSLPGAGAVRALRRFAWTHFNLSADDESLYAFGFQLLYMAVLSNFSARKRRWFWTTMPSLKFIAVRAANMLLDMAVAYARPAGRMFWPKWQTSSLYGFAMVARLAVNDTVKAGLNRKFLTEAAKAL